MGVYAKLVQFVFESRSSNVDAHTRVNRLFAPPASPSSGRSRRRVRNFFPRRAKSISCISSQR
jgi:hypothetical protein